MPEQIPILYTGLNAAAPDWKSFNANFSARMAQVQQRQQQQAQFDALQNERRRKEFLENLDVDALNTTNENLLNKKYEMVKGFEDYATKSLIENPNITDKQLLEARQFANRINQENTKYNNWSKNWEIDRKAAESNLNIYDPKKVRENITNWDGNTPYDKSRLNSVYRDVSVDEVRTRWFQKMKDADTFVTTAGIAGQNIDGQGTYDNTYFNKVVNKDGTEKIVPDYPAQVGFMKAQIARDGELGLLDDIAFDKQFNSSGKDNIEFYNKKARLTTGREDDAKYLYELDKSEGKYFESSEFTPNKVEKTDKSTSGDKDTRDPIDLRQVTEGSIASKPVPITGTITYFDKEGKEQTYNAGLNDVRLTKIYYDKARKEWMVDGILKRGTTEEDLDEGIFSRTINDPITMTYDSVKEDINRTYNVLLPTETKKKKAY